MPLLLRQPRSKMAQRHAMAKRKAKWFKFAEADLNRRLVSLLKKTKSDTPSMRMGSSTIRQKTKRSLRMIWLARFESVFSRLGKCSLAPRSGRNNTNTT